MYKTAKSNIEALFRKIAEEKELYLPIKTGGQVNFAAWDETSEVSLETLKTVKSPKDAFFPQFETLYTCKTQDKQLQITPEKLKDMDFVVFGMKACDIQGLKVLDKVFLNEPVDTYYAARRAHGTIVALACGAPDSTCFCNAFGIDAAAPEADVTIWMIEDEIFWKPLTKKGESLTASVSALLDETDDQSESVKKEQEKIHEITARLPYAKLSLEGWNAESLNEKFDSPIWEDLYKPCLACGTCTFVCPACQCYDIMDYQTKDGVQRYRCWDSCMYSDFTLMAGGNNRTTQMQRFRQRFMHKLVYFPANNGGMYSCTGCGRCVEKCPASLNIIKVIKAFGKGKREEK